MSTDRQYDSPGLKPSSYFFLAIVTFFMSALIVANPGFYSHDEWQIHDFVEKAGLPWFISTFGRVYVGSDFGSPVRPIGFIWEGLTTFGMRGFPVAPHVFSVFLHIVVTLLFAKVVRLAGAQSRQALIAGLLFGASPLAGFAVGWTAACFDPWYSLFALLVAWQVVNINRDGFNVIRISALIAGSAAAILSKETAIILPGAAAALAVALDSLQGKAIAWRRAAYIGTLVSIPTLAYISFRFPAIVASAHKQAGPYTPSIMNIPYNSVMYIAFPFLPKVGEMATGMAVSDWQLAAAVGAHFLLVAAIVWRFGWLPGVIYLAGYFVFLLPILTIQSVGTHYIYACGLSLSLALALLIVDGDGKIKILSVSLFGLVAAAVLTVHLFYVQADLYEDGICQRNFLTSLDAQIEGQAKQKELVIQPVPEARYWVALRAVFQRESYAHVRMISDTGPSNANFSMDAACRVIYRGSSQ